MHTLTICVWLHYIEIDGRLLAILRLSGEVCTGDLAFDEIGGW